MENDHPSPCRRTELRDRYSNTRGPGLSIAPQGGRTNWVARGRASQTRNRDGPGESLPKRLLPPLPTTRTLPTHTKGTSAQRFNILLGSTLSWRTLSMLSIRPLRGVRSISLCILIVALRLILTLVLGLTAPLMQENMMSAFALRAHLRGRTISYHMTLFQAQEAHSFGGHHHSTLLRSEHLEHSTTFRRV